MLLYIRRKEVTVVTMVSMRQTIPRTPHTIPIYWPIHALIFPCQALIFGASTPGLEFRENLRERAARSPTNRSQRFDPPSPRCARLPIGHVPVVTTSANWYKECV